MVYAEQVTRQGHLGNIHPLSAHNFRGDKIWGQHGHYVAKTYLRLLAETSVDYVGEYRGQFDPALGVSSKLLVDGLHVGLHGRFGRAVGHQVPQTGKTCAGG